MYTANPLNPHELTIRNQQVAGSAGGVLPITQALRLLGMLTELTGYGGARAELTGQSGVGTIVGTTVQNRDYG